MATIIARVLVGLALANMKKITWYPAEEGDERIVTFFALWPIQLGNDWRWFETVTVRYRCFIENRNWLPGGPNFGPVWRKIEFVKEKQKTW